MRPTTEATAAVPGAGGPASPKPYEPPALREIGSVYTLTLTGRGGCWWGKKWGGSDGIQFMGINVPISSC